MASGDRRTFLTDPLIARTTSLIVMGKKNGIACPCNDNAEFNAAHNGKDRMSKFYFQFNMADKNFSISLHGVRLENLFNFLNLSLFHRMAFLKNIR